MARSGLAELSGPDLERVKRLAISFEAIKQAAEFFGRRPRRFHLLASGPAAASAELPANAKRLHFIRHGEGAHNVWRHEAFAAGRMPHAKRGNAHEVPQDLLDPSLTDKGQDEARAARGAASYCEPKLLVTSPLRRAVQTLLLAFRDAVASGTPIIAHELCREQFQGLDPSLYDGRRGRRALAAEFPQVDFESFVLAEEDCGTAAPEPSGPVVAGSDPLWWHCGSVFGGCEGGTNEAAVAENAWGFLKWLMARPERDIAVATHSFFLLALYHAALGGLGGGKHCEPQFFHTGELRSLVVLETDPPEAVGGHLSRWGAPLLAQGLRITNGPGPEAGNRKRPRDEAAPEADASGATAA